MARNRRQVWRFPSSRPPGERIARMAWALAKPSWGGFPQLEQIEEGVMAKVLAVLALIATFLLVAPGIEAGASGSTQFFHGICTAESGGGEAEPPPQPVYWL